MSLARIDYKDLWFPSGMLCLVLSWITLSGGSQYHEKTQTDFREAYVVRRNRDLPNAVTLERTLSHWTLRYFQLQPTAWLKLHERRQGRNIQFSHMEQVLILRNSEMFVIYSAKFGVICFAVIENYYTYISLLSFLLKYKLFDHYWYIFSQDNTWLRL